MDERRKQISELEKRKKDQSILLDAQLSRIGETLFNRIPDKMKEEPTVFPELSVFRRLRLELSKSEDQIIAAEEKIIKFNALEENIETGKKEEKDNVRELAGVYSKLGKRLLEVSDNNNYENFCSPFRNQADTLKSKIMSHEDRIAALEHRDSGNIFSWIGKSAQSMVLRSFLSKANENIEQLYRKIGERYSRQDNLHVEKKLKKNSQPEDEEINSLCEEIERRREILRELSQDLTGFNEEKRKIHSEYSHDGGPQKYIQARNNHINNVQKELKILFRQIGSEACGIFSIPVNIPPKRSKIIDSLKLPEDYIEFDNAVKINQYIQEDEKSIEKLRISLLIDDEKARIEKYLRLIQEKKEEIAQANKGIIEYEKYIYDANERIKKSEELLKEL